LNFAIANNVAIGAHPGLLTRSFWKKRNEVYNDEVYDLTVAQIKALKNYGYVSHTITSCKPHGALHNMV
jgi:lactam utilization protein B